MPAGADQRIAARRLAMDLLARREHSRFELERKLIRRDFPAALVDAVLDDLQAENLQDDGRFVAAFVRSRLTRGKGPRKVIAELSDRGISAGLVGEALEEAGADWVAVAKEALAKRFGNQPVNDYKDRARRLRFLAQRGFTGEQSRAAVSSLYDAAELVTDEEV